MNINNKIKDLSKEKLFRLYQQSGKKEYFEELYKRYIPMLYGLCLKYLRNEADAQDTVMDLYVELSEKMSQYEIRNFHTWLYSVAKNHCLQRLRKAKKLQMVDFDDDFMENSVFFTLIDEQKSADEKAALEYCLDTLSKEQRKSIEYFYYENKSYADIVLMTGYAQKKVKSYIQNGKRNLKNCIEKVLKKEKR